MQKKPFERVLQTLRASFCPKSGLLQIIVRSGESVQDVRKVRQLFLQQHRLTLKPPISAREVRANQRTINPDRFPIV
jgi:hypothetical protein